MDKLTFHDGVTLSMSLGPGNSGRNYILHKPDNSRSVRKTMNSALQRHFTYTLHERDIGGAEEITEIQSRGLGKVASALRIAAKNVMEFFSDIMSEAGFYMAAINLIREIESRNGRICFPIPTHDKTISFAGLYDLGLLLSTDTEIVSNNMESHDTGLFIITGANRGGKSTFLRSIGQAQLLMQAGIFAPSERLKASTVSGIYTHFKSEEDRNLNRGKFEDELSRMDEIVNHLTGNGMVLFNESFSSTNTREGSEIAMEITRALLENGVTVFFVSHLYEFASAVAEEVHKKSLFLVAERTEHGQHTYRIIPGTPQETGHGMDLYNKIFGEQNGNTENSPDLNE
jgi:DNA mismatch repair ATPase MutS